MKWNKNEIKPGYLKSNYIGVLIKFAQYFITPFISDRPFLVSNFYACLFERKAQFPKIQVYLGTKPIKFIWFGIYKISDQAGIN